MNFPDHERWDIIRGEAYAMRPASNTLHQRVAGELFRMQSTPFTDFNVDWDAVCGQ